MAAPVTTPTATTLEGQMLETAREFKQAEDAWITAGQAADPVENRARRMNLTVNPTAGTATITVTLPITEADSADGVSFAAAEYIV